MKKGKGMMHALLYLRISRTKVVKASSTLIRCLADVSMNRQLKCFARSRPSGQMIDSLAEPYGVRCDTRTIEPHLPFIFKITLIGNNNNGEDVSILDSQDLLIEGADFLKRVPRGDRIYKKEAFSGPHVLFSHGTKFESVSLMSDWEVVPRLTHILLARRYQSG